MTYAHVSILIAAVAAFAAGGCRSSAEVEVDEERARADVISRDRDARLAGERVVVIRDVPANAVKVDEARGRSLMYAPDRPGTVYVYDLRDEKMIYASHLHAGERFVVDPLDDRATVNGRTAFSSDLDADHSYRLYFMQD